MNQISPNCKSVSTPWFLAFVAICALLLASCESPGPSDNNVTSREQDTSTSLPLSGLDQERYLSAVSRISEGRLKEAERTLLKLSKDYGNNQEVLVNLATVYLKQKKNRKAKELCERSVENGASIAEIHNILGLIAVDERDFAKAEAHYLKAISLDKGFANAHYNLALLYDIYYQDIPKAYAQYQKYLALKPGDKETQDWVEQLQYSLDRG